MEVRSAATADTAEEFSVEKLTLVLASHAVSPFVRLQLRLTPLEDALIAAVGDALAELLLVGRGMEG
jgi:hypothetical protein